MTYRDYDLIKNGRYNHRAIMQRAYAYVRNYKYPLSSGLKIAWCDAHLKWMNLKHRFPPCIKIIKNRITISDRLW